MTEAQVVRREFEHVRHRNTRSAARAARVVHLVVGSWPDWLIDNHNETAKQRDDEPAAAPQPLAVSLPRCENFGGES